ncbi:MAG: hypothetical protein EOO27_33945 [Comamonadaceae bacterium]|nr:MAG: hypothetical protein EOO27_33945 [Comamonadaceae bacterium]
MDNRRPDFKLALSEQEGGGHLLRDAVNVDVTAQGSLKTRAGFALAEQGLDCHSGWAPIGGAYGLYCDSGDIFRLDVAEDGSTTRNQIASGYGRVTPVVFAEVQEAVYFTDGIRVGSYHPTPGPTPRWLDAGYPVFDDVQRSPMPAGSCIAHHINRLLVAVGQYLIYSDPFTPHLRDESQNFLVFPAAIACIVAIEAGVFVMADKTYFLPGGVPSQAMRAVLQYGAPVQMPSCRADGGAQWMSERGIISVSASGELSNLQEDRVALRASGAAATLYRESDGMNTIVAALSKPSSTAAGVGSYAEARIVRKVNP